jgi:hypothetical protein
MIRTLVRVLAAPATPAALAALALAFGGALIFGGALGCGGTPAAAPPADPAVVGTGAAGGGGGGGSAGAGPRANDPRCDAVRPRIEQLYRAEAQARALKRVDEAVSDNTTMVLNDCVQAPDRVAACVRAAQTSQELEAKCLVHLDDEGTEGDRIAR